MEQVQKEYWEKDIWKVNEFNFLNEEVEEFISSWSQNLVNVRSGLSSKTFLAEKKQKLLLQFGSGDGRF